MATGFGFSFSRIAALVIVLPIGSAPAAEAPMALSCEAFAKTADEAALTARFGRTNVVTVDLEGAEGAAERGTAIFPKDPARRVEIFWFDAAHRRRPSTIRVRGRSAWTLKPPGVASPLGIGTGVKAVETANGRPFTLVGFNWDMGGFSSGWKGGALETLPGGCVLSLRFAPDGKATAKALDKVSGDRQLSSADTAVRAVSPTVTELSLGWPE